VCVCVCVCVCVSVCVCVPERGQKKQVEAYTSNILDENSLTDPDDP
jgi:hypothetical protein